ncbi:hypothetical protein ACFO5X_24405 [Seohaeicola nanhaiensis]|uniref:Histidinol phosphate aminotransferase n=1 Tax=Seohaeicola nanhaiensis TaxID=1387282 RepID=A0ABV9KNI4_9RHOB
MPPDRSTGIAPNYTTPALIMLGVNLGWLFLLIWATAGMAAVLLLAMALNHLITRLRDRLD